MNWRSKKKEAPTFELKKKGSLIYLVFKLQENVPHASRNKKLKQYVQYEKAHHALNVWYLIFSPF